MPHPAAGPQHWVLLLLSQRLPVRSETVQTLLQPCIPQHAVEVNTCHLKDTDTQTSLFSLQAWSSMCTESTLGLSYTRFKFHAHQVLLPVSLCYKLVLTLSIICFGGSLSAQIFGTGLTGSNN